MVVVVVAARVREVISAMIWTGWSHLLLLILLSHPSGREAWEYRCGVPSPLRSISSLSDASFNTVRPDCGDGECKQAIYLEERKTHCQTKKTKQRKESIEIPVKFPENTRKDQDEKTQTGCRSRIDGDVVEKRSTRLRIEGKNKKIRLQKEIQNIQK